ncbi:aminotransferase class V-fold PLP-dependent enzyme [Nonomuraea turkmeniaca]|uniref:cysteine desulfurase n=1 Tax=Nonomuraea turkmeniaca TaxID=103838 RepID=A0A5S4FPE2_9ACTN|nr:aminotransferase class V-fold PLP-dependent enzyme [Nonomuraea turkmeniaca]TMR22627.1 aminotransferase class V-fold PLP-dependent enzyme [Nonomuraea turkmeniaca]
MTVYLDFNATTPVDPRVADEIVHYLVDEYGNAGSRTHELGQRAQKAANRARRQVAEVVDAQDDEVIFTSGATEANNLALLGLAPEGDKISRRHIVSTAIEHKAVLEPLARLDKMGFDVQLVDPGPSGRVAADDILAAVRPDTLAVSVMAANNETGILQPIEEICQRLEGHDLWLHVDAAQTFGKELDPLRSHRIDLMSISAHKVFGPMGVGALVARSRDYRRPPLKPLMFGGGQERGLRPGTLPVPLVAGFGLAAELAGKEQAARHEACLRYRSAVLAGLAPLQPVIHGDEQFTLPHVVNLSLPGVDSEAVMLAWRGIVAVSNGSACTSNSYEPSHVLTAMGVPDNQVRGALRLSWSHMSPPADWAEAVDRVRALT